MTKFQGVLAKLANFLFLAKVESQLKKPVGSVLTLGQSQKRFSLMVGLLLLKAYRLSFEVSLGDAWARTTDVTKSGRRTHKTWSNHYDRLAIDLNLFKNGKYLKQTEAHQELGEYWESLGGAWGGRFKDGNHYSIEYKGRK